MSVIEETVTKDLMLFFQKGVNYVHVVLLIRALLHVQCLNCWWNWGLR